MSGLFGVVSKKKDSCIDSLIYGTDYQAHMGSEYGGLAVLGNNSFARFIHRMSNANFRDKFFESIKNIEVHSGIGVISDLEEQPIYMKSKVGEFCIVTSGRIVNMEELAKEMMDAGICFSEFSKSHVNMTELVARIVSTGQTIQDGIKLMFGKIKGSCSLLILTREGIYAARDYFGRTALVLGQDSESFAICSETCGFANLGYRTIRDLNPGEIL